MTLKSKTSKIVNGISYLLQGTVSLFLALGAVNNIIKTETAILNAAFFGYTVESLTPLAIILLISVALYLIPRTAILGAVLITGWFGGAIATHIIHRDSTLFFSMPVLFSMLTWGAIVIRNADARAIFLPRKS